MKKHIEVKFDKTFNAATLYRNGKRVMTLIAGFGSNVSALAHMRSEANMRFNVAHCAIKVSEGRIGNVFQDTFVY